MAKYINTISKLFRGDQLTKFEIMKLISKKLYPKYRFKWPQMDWWENRDFTHYLEKFNEANGMNTDRRWMLSQLLRLTSDVAGDTAECGVYKGAGSYLICKFNNELDDSIRMHHVFDSFEGLSQPSTKDSYFWKEGNLSAPLEEVKYNLTEFEKIKYYKGWIPNRFAEIENTEFSFVHIDVDLYEPTRDSINFFYSRMNPGGIILCDDYGFDSCPGATAAIDELLFDKPEKMVSLCSGGGFMIKGCKTQG